MKSKKELIEIAEKVKYVREHKNFFMREIVLKLEENLEYSAVKYGEVKAYHNINKDFLLKTISKFILNEYDDKQIDTLYSELESELRFYFSTFDKYFIKIINFGSLSEKTIIISAEEIKEK